MGLLTHKKHGLTKEVLEELYAKKYMSDGEIAKIYGLSDAAVSYFRRKFGIRTFTAEEKIACKAMMLGLKDITTLNNDELNELYKRYGQRQLAKMYGCSRILIKRKLKEANISSLDKDDRIHINLPDKLTDMQNQLIYGSLLGDGHVRMSENGMTARYSECHSEKQKGYLEWKRDLLHPFSMDMRRHDKVLEDGRLCKGFCFRSHYHREFVQFRNLFYVNDIKVLPNDFEQKLDPLILAVWYMDDGSLDVSFIAPNGKYSIASGFPFSDVEKMAMAMNRKFDLDVECKEYDDINKLVINNKDKFFNMIKDYVQPCVYYKISIQQRFSMPKISKPHLKDMLERMPEKIDGITEDERELIVNDIVDFWHVCGFPYSHHSDWWGQYMKNDSISDVQNSNLKIVDDIEQGYGQGCSYCISNFPNFFKVIHNGKKSAMEMFLNRDSLKHIIEDCYRFEGKPDKDNLRETLKEHGRIYTFRPVVAKAIYDKYCNEGSKILDPCAGWGGRLFGFYCCDKSVKYTGIDACAETVKGLKHMKCMLNRSIKNKDVDIFYEAFEDWSTVEKYDVIFTSPPYFCKEIYSGEDKQSSSRYKTYHEWKEKFLYRLVDKSYKLLNDGGYFIINIDDIKIGISEYRLADDFFEYAKIKFKHIFTHRMKYRNFYVGTEHFEPIFVFQK